jgi:hypothetical protein
LMYFSGSFFQLLMPSSLLQDVYKGDTKGSH